MNRVLLFAAAVTLAACGRMDAGDDFRRGVPSADDVKLNVPEKAGQGLSGVRQDELEGDRSNFYLLTRVVTATVNGGTAAVLGLVRAIVDHPPTRIDGNQAIWGPHTEPLSPNTYRFIVTRNADNDYSYVLEGKGKTEPDASFRVVLSGSHLVATDAAGNPLEKFGNGSFLIDWDKAQQLPEHDSNVGSVIITYSRLSPAHDVLIDASFRQVKDNESGKLIDAEYRYVAKPGAGGSFDFSVIKDLHGSATVLETATIRSRWQQDGAGRSDVKAKGGDLTTEATANECWDSNFASRFLELSYAPAQGWGSQSACVFAQAEYSKL